MLEPLAGKNPSALFRDALSGEVHGVDELAPVRLDRAFWYAWARSHRGTRVLAY